MTNTNRTLDSNLRRAAKSVGLRVRKARGQLYRRNGIGYMLINDRNVCVHGSQYELTADDVIRWCAGATS